MDQSILALKIVTGTANASSARNVAKISLAKDFLPTAMTSSAHLVAKFRLKLICRLSPTIVTTKLIFYIIILWLLFYLISRLNCPILDFNFKKNHYVCEVIDWQIHMA